MSTKGTIENKKLNTVIVDDDTQARKLLTILLKKFPQVNVVGEASSMSGAIDIIKQKKPDSVFLDICLGSDSGFELMEKISKEAKVVFVSAYDDYALRAFEVNALDYLKKPVGYDRLALTIDRLLSNDGLVKSNFLLEDEDQNSSQQNAESKDQKNKGWHIKSVDELSSKFIGVIDDEDDSPDNEEFLDEEETLTTLDPSRKVLEYDDRLFITSDGVSKFIKISSILCITAEKDYSYICMVNGKKLLVLKPMVEWENRLTPKYFARIHRSTIVNLEFVEKVEKWFNSSYRVYLQNIAEPFQMSRRYAAKLKEKFK